MTDAQAALAEMRASVDVHAALADLRAVLERDVNPTDGRACFACWEAFWRECTPANIAAILAHVEAQAAEIERLTAERDELRRQLAEAQKEIHNLNWALGTEGYDQMATPEEQAEHEKAVRAHHDVLERLEEGKRAYEAMKRDARRYRWLRPRFFAADFAYGDPPVCAIVFRWPKNAKVSVDLDREIDAAMGASNE